MILIFLYAILGTWKEITHSERDKIMGEYRCEGIGNINGGTYDRLHVEGVFSAKGPVKANQISGEGVMKFTTLSAETLTLEGVTKVDGLLEAGTCNSEGVLKAGAVMVSGNLYSDGVINTAMLKADSATLLHNSKKESPRPFARVRSIFSGRDIRDEKNARIREIEANTLVIEDYSVQKITGKDVVIGRGCFVDKVIATTKLRIHKTAQVKDFIGSVMPEYFE